MIARRIELEFNVTSKLWSGLQYSTVLALLQVGGLRTCNESAGPHVMT